MRALDPEVKDAVWQAIGPLIPVPLETHPLGVHRRRKPNRLAFEVMLVRLVTGCSFEDAERLCGNTISDPDIATALVGGRLKDAESAPLPGRM
ncbi:MAG TPA: hypothetical protein VGL60_11305 [Acidimicrobiales bacterium]|jgi:hypothetical protein